MLNTKERRPAYRSLESWAVGMLLGAGAIEECADHDFRQCRADPETRAEAFDAARADPYPGHTPDQAVAALKEILGSIGETCPEC